MYGGTEDQHLFQENKEINVQNEGEQGTGKQIKFQAVGNIGNRILILVKHGNKPFILEDQGNRSLSRQDEREKAIVNVCMNQKVHPK